jgi:hypothetical protein
MDDDTAYEVCQHTYGAITWLFKYIIQHDLTFVPEDRVDILNHHLDRIDALFTGLEEPLSHDPVVRDLKENRPRDKLTPYRGGYPQLNM